MQEREGYELMPEMGYRPVNRYLPPRPRLTTPGSTGARGTLKPVETEGGNPFLRWVDRVLSR